MIKVVDALMGEGKTTKLMDIMNSRPQDKWIYISPFLDEVEERLPRECPSLSFKSPQQVNGKKYWGLDYLIEEGANIGSTHALFSKVDIRLIQALKGKGYNLIIDEALDVVGLSDIPYKDIQHFIDTGHVYLDERSFVRWNHERCPNDVLSRYPDLPHLCDNGNLCIVRDKVVMWQFPHEFLSGFDEVFIATYMFEGQAMATYLKMYDIDYEMLSLDDEGNLVPYDEVDTHQKKLDLASRIHIYHDRVLTPMGKKSGKSYPFSKGWYSRMRKLDNGALTQIKKRLETFFKMARTKPEDNMVGVFDAFWADIKGVRYGIQSKSGVPINARASNEWMNKKALAYMVDIHPHAMVSSYFEEQGIHMRGDLYALQTLVQWIWRSAIRDKDYTGKVQLVLPSERMNSIVSAWIKHEDRDIVAGINLDPFDRTRKAA